MLPELVLKQSYIQPSNLPTSHFHNLYSTMFHRSKQKSSDKTLKVTKILCFFYKLLRRMTMIQSLSFQNNSCLYPAGKRRKEIGLLDSSRGSAKRIKSWQISENCLNTYLLPGDVLFVKQQQKLEVGRRV